MFASGDWIYWLAILGIGAVFGVLIYIAWWALFADRRNRQRRRCPRCWYDLAYSPGMTCGECGFTAERESQFHAVRRRYRAAAAAIGACVIAAIVINEHVTQSGWASSLPTRALFMLLPLTSGPNNSIAREITSRAALGQLSAGDWDALIDRCAAGDFAARPAGDSWRAKYGNFIWLWRQGLQGNASVNRRLNAIAPHLEITARENWPANMPIVVQVDVEDWWQWGMECRVKVTPRINGAAAGESLTFYRTGDDRIPRRGFPLTLPAMSASPAEIALDFEIARRPMLRSSPARAGQVSGDSADADQAAEPAWEVVASRSEIVNMRIDPPERQTLAAVENDPQIQALLAQVFGTGVVKWHAGSSPVRVRVNQPVTFQPLLNDFALGLRVELLRDGEVARQLNLWWLAGANIEDHHYGFEVASENLLLLRFANDADGHWQMRITGDPSLALRAAGGTKCWKGQFTVPMTVQTMSGESPARAWWTEE